MASQFASFEGADVAHAHVPGNTIDSTIVNAAAMGIIAGHANISAGAHVDQFAVQAIGSQDRGAAQGL